MLSARVRCATLLAACIMHGCAPSLPAARAPEVLRGPAADLRVELHPRQMREHAPCAKLLGALSDVGSFANAGALSDASLQADTLSLHVWEGEGARRWVWLLEGIDANQVPSARDGVEQWQVRPTTWAMGDMPSEARWWLTAPRTPLCEPDSPACAQFRGDFLRARVSRLREGPLAVIALGLLRLTAGLSGPTCAPEARFVYSDATHAQAAGKRFEDVLMVMQKRIEEAGWGGLEARVVGPLVTVGTKQKRRDSF